MSQVIDNNNRGVDLTSKGSGRFVKTFSLTIGCCCMNETGDACSQAPEKCRLSVLDSLLLAVHRSRDLLGRRCISNKDSERLCIVTIVGRVVVVVLVPVVGGGGSSSI
jgi:hypothetical protein